MAIIKTGNATVDDVFTTYKADIRLTMDDMGIVEKFVNRETLPKNEGTTWNRAKLSRATSYSWNEGEPHPEVSLTSSLQTITPAQNGLKVGITQRHMDMAQENLGSKIAKVIGQALSVYKDEQLISNFDSFTASLPGANTALTLGGIRAAVARIRDGSGEPYNGSSIYGILHPFQMHDVLESAGNYSSGNPQLGDSGVPDELMRKYIVANLVGVAFAQDANIATDGSDDAKGAVFAREAIDLIDFTMPDTDKEFDKDTKSWFFYGDQDFGHGVYSLTWGVEIYSDVTAPTA